MSEKENEVILEQDYLKCRVVRTDKDEYDIEFAMLEGPSIGITEPSELIAKSIYAGLHTAYIAGLTELQTKMREALTSLADEAKVEADDHILDT